MRTADKNKNKNIMWFRRSLLRSLATKKGRVAVTVLALAIATAMLVMAGGIYLGISEKLGSELKTYGANVLMSPGGDAFYLGEDVLQRLAGEPLVSGMTPQLYQAALLMKEGGTRGAAHVEVIGTDVGRLVEGMRLEGKAPAEGEILLGANLRDALKAAVGESVTVKTGDGVVWRLRVSGLIETGGKEDNAIIAPLAEVQRIFSLQGKLSAVLLRARPGQSERAVSRLGEMFPSASLKTLRQVASAENAFLNRMELLVLLFSVVIVFASAVSVSGTAAATLYERLKEIGLMKALGATAAQIRWFYLAEAAVVGTLGGVTGYGIGFAGALAASRGAFGSHILVSPALLPVACAAGVLIAVLASIVPLSGALRLKPSLVLRGSE